MKLAKNLKDLCIKQGLSFSELARQASVPVQTLHAWTIGRRSVNPEQLRRVAQVLRVSFHELLFGTPDPYEVGHEELLKELFSGDLRVTIHKVERLPRKR